jgi:hypothetical protein
MVSHREFQRVFSYIGQGKVTAKNIADRHTVAAKAQALSSEVIRGDASILTVD